MVGNCSYQHLLMCLIFSCYGNVFFMINVKMETTGKKQEQTTNNLVEGCQLSPQTTPKFNYFSLNNFLRNLYFTDVTLKTNFTW